MYNNCKVCSKIYRGFDDYEKHHPNYDTYAFVKNKHNEIIFYIPCEDNYYDEFYHFNYCPFCGRLVNKNLIIYR